MTDHWRTYTEFLPETIHAQSKAETYTVEGYNSILRHFLARLRRKDKVLYEESGNAKVLGYAIEEIQK